MALYSMSRMASSVGSDLIYFPYCLALWLIQWVYVYTPVCQGLWCHVSCLISFVMENTIIYSPKVGHKLCM